MARSQVNDHLLGFRFHVTTVKHNGTVDPIKRSREGDDGSPGAEAGFQSVTLPEVTSEVSEYREGNSTFSRKYPGPPTWSDSTLIRGITANDTVFFDWAKSTWEGREYRVDLRVMHFAREDVGGLLRGAPVPSRSYLYHECVPTRVKPAADFDSTSTEISLAEVDVALEWMEIETVGAATGD